MSDASSFGARRILVIDDQPEIHEDIRRVLCTTQVPASLSLVKAKLFGGEPDAKPSASGERFEIASALQGREGALAVVRAGAERERFEVAIVDMRMPPGWDGVQTIRALWETDPSLQVVLCTAYSDEALDRVAADLGRADQFVILKKPFEPIEIRQLTTALSEKWRAERRAERRLEELEELVEERTKEIRHAALHDKLTALPNREQLSDRLGACIDLAHRDPTRRFALLFIDLDGFKKVNDLLGHTAGDELLVQVAERIRGTLRSHDMLAPASFPARFGGDEFLVLLDGLRRTSDAARVAARLLTALSQPYQLGDHGTNITASIGLTTSDRSYRTATEIIRDADIALYRAKSEGRARFTVFDAAMHREVSASLELERALRRAIETDAIELHYQPIVRLADGFVEGFEALARWTDPELGPIAAADLISAAEETGLIQELGLRLLRRATLQLVEWHRAFPGAEDLRLSVNLSRRQLLESEFSSRVAEVIRESGVDATKLALEITETTVLPDIDAAIAVCRRLRALGVEIHIDDFGSGYSAISHLHLLPASAMKIDRTFVARALSETSHEKMIEALVRIARVFGLDVIAEGIETPDELEMVKRLGIARGQGYLFSKAVPTSEASAIVSSRWMPLRPGEAAPLVQSRRA